MITYQIFRWGFQSISICLLMSMGGLSLQAELVTTRSACDLPWNLERLHRTPVTWDADGFESQDLRALFYEGLPYQGRPTRVFAWYGVPETQPGEQVPAMVLVHGGGGTAFERWVRLWVDRGYAAIAMDTCGHTGRDGKRESHDLGGPDGWGGFETVNEPIDDQWAYHAVADVILAHSLIRSLPEVDADRIGVTGISWGGFLTCIVSGIDTRFQFAVPVYGCGYLGAHSAWVPMFEKMGEAKSAKWLELWDPSNYLKSTQMPTLWVTGTNDFAFPLDALQKSYRLTPGPHTLCIRIRMVHGHGGPGENPEEIHAFANSFVKDGPPLARITNEGKGDHKAWVAFTSEVPIESAELCYTTDRGKWQDRHWESKPAELLEDRNRAVAALPDGTTVYYFNLTDARDLIVSSDHVMIEHSSEAITSTRPATSLPTVD